VTALDNAGLMPGVRAKVADFPPSAEKDTLIEILGNGTGQAENAQPGKAVLAKAAFSS
jgi:hypothetical protein